METFNWSNAWVGLFFVTHWTVVLWLEWRQRTHVRRHANQVPQAFVHEVTLAAHQSAARYAVDRSRLNAGSATLGLTEALFWTLGGGLTGLHAWTTRLWGYGLIPELILMASFVLVHALVQLPLSWYSTFVIESRHGFNRSSTSLWLIDQLKGWVLGLSLGLPLMAAVIHLMSEGGPHWWIGVWALWMGFQLVLMVVAPRWLMPLFNTFTPFDDQTIRPKAEALMQAVGFKAKDFQVMDASRRSAHANAFFTGLGSEKRVVFFDTLLKQLHAGEVIAVLAHELGHFKLRHVLWMILAQALLSAFFLFGLSHLMIHLEWLQPAGILPAPGGSAHALLLLAVYWLLPPALFFFKPLSSAFSRRREFEADAFASLHAPAADLRSALVKLYKENASTLTPDPTYVWFHHSHPPALDRLARLHA